MIICAKYFTICIFTFCIHCIYSFFFCIIATTHMGMIIICKIGDNPTCKNGIIGIIGPYDHLPATNAYFSIRTANMNPVIAISNILLKSTFRYIKKCPKIIDSNNKIMDMITTSPTLALMCTMINPISPT